MTSSAAGTNGFLFCDLRGYTAFAETAEPEEVLDFLRQYHGALGPLVSQLEGTLDRTLDRLAKRAGFAEVSHRLDLIGRCANCA